MISQTCARIQMCIPPPGRPQRAISLRLAPLPCLPCISRLRADPAVENGEKAVKEHLWFEVSEVHRPPPAPRSTQ